MSDTPKIHEFESLEKLVDRLRDDFVSGNQDFLLICRRASFVADHIEAWIGKIVPSLFPQQGE